jgi:hypothetical protein
MSSAATAQYLHRVMQFVTMQQSLFDAQTYALQTSMHSLLEQLNELRQASHAIQNVDTEQPIHASFRRYFEYTAMGFDSSPIRPSASTAEPTDDPTINRDPRRRPAHARVLFNNSA